MPMRFWLRGTLTETFDAIEMARDVIGLLGIAMVSINYFIYKKILNKDKAKYKDQIIKLSDELLND